MAITEVQLQEQILATEGNRRHFARPQPVRGLKFTGGEIVWEKPSDAAWNVTSYRIYANNETNLVREVPVDQTHLTGIAANSLFVSAYNSTSQLESVKTQLLGPVAITGVSLNIPQFGIGPNGTLTLSGLTWTDNAPGASQVTWGYGGVATYKGISYSLQNGNSSVNSFFLIWQPSAPTLLSSVTSFPLTLGADDFIVAVVTSGKFKPCISLTRGDGQGRSILYSEGVFQINSSGNLVVSVASGSGAAGTFEIADSSGNNVVQLKGEATATTATGGSQSLPANPAAFLLVHIGGTIAGGGSTQYKIPLYNT